ncbi:hypothetical protein PINS_up011310 [Pythium insidiosum]|nr:hypothetical protein PINS_up011310 [Pythium insidiosum]
MLSVRRPDDGNENDNQHDAMELGTRQRSVRSARLPIRSLGDELPSQRRRVTAGYSADEDDDDLLAGLEGFGCYDSDGERPAALGDPAYTRRSRRVRLRVASENDDVMVGKVCRRCVELKVITLRRETLMTIKPSRGVSLRRPSRRPQETVEEGEEPASSSSPASASASPRRRDDVPLLADDDDDLVGADAERDAALSQSAFSVGPADNEPALEPAHRENVARMHLRELLADTDDESDSEVEDRSTRRLAPSQRLMYQYQTPPSLLRSSSAPAPLVVTPGAAPPPLPSRQFERDLKPLAIEFLELP